jgi:hypothetical protein
MAEASDSEELFEGEQMHFVGQMNPGCASALAPNLLIIFYFKS